MAKSSGGIELKQVNKWICRANNRETDAEQQLTSRPSPPHTDAQLICLDKQIIILLFSQQKNLNNYCSRDVTEGPKLWGEQQIQGFLLDNQTHSTQPPRFLLALYSEEQWPRLLGRVFWRVSSRPSINVIIKVRVTTCQGPEIFRW